MSRLLLAFTLVLGLGGLGSPWSGLFELTAAQELEKTDAGSQWDPNGKPTESGGQLLPPTGSDTEAGGQWDPNG